MSKLSSYDESFGKIKSLSFYPWVGENYQASACKVLFVGESHYGTARELTPADRTMKTRLVLDECIRGICVPPFFRQLTEAFFGGDFSGWNSVAFCNYVQDTMQTAKLRPSAALLRAAWVPFEAVLDTLQPDVVICASAKVYRAMPTTANGAWEVFAPLSKKPMVRHAVYHSLCKGKTRDTVFYAYWHPSYWHFVDATCQKQLQEILRNLGVLVLG